MSISDWSSDVCSSDLTAIYDQHDKAFARVSAYVVTKDGAHVANVSIKFPADGAGRLYAYVHWIGLEMVRDHATGYGYDKRTAAVSGCAARILQHLDAPNVSGIHLDLLACRPLRPALAHNPGPHRSPALAATRLP